MVVKVRPIVLKLKLAVDLGDHKMKFVSIIDATDFLLQFKDQSFGGRQVDVIEKSAYDDLVKELKFYADIIRPKRQNTGFVRSDARHTLRDCAGHDICGGCTKDAGENKRQLIIIVAGAAGDHAHCIYADVFVDIDRQVSRVGKTSHRVEDAVIIIPKTKDNVIFMQDGAIISDGHILR